MKFDSHCHPYLLEDTDDIIRESQSAGVGVLLCVGTGDKENAIVEKLATSHFGVYFTVGQHPLTAENLNTSQIREYLKHPKCLAIGETGLDYFKNQNSPQQQWRSLKEQEAMALEYNLPLIIHNRSSDKDMAHFIQETSAKGVLHSFCGGEKLLQTAVKKGWYVSFSGMITFKSNDALRKLIPQVPLSQVLVETDSPYLAPEPYRGKKCKPYYVLKVYEKLADIYQLTLSELELQLWQNFQTCFQKYPAALNFEKNKKHRER
jgi:TatD DNase family protein